MASQRIPTGTFGFRLEEGTQGGVKIEGLSKVRKAFKDLSDDIDYRAQEFLPVNKAIAAQVASDARGYVPIRSGDLSATIRDAATKTSAKVRVGYKASVQYAGPIHFGWPARRIKPQPFVYEAIDRRRGEIKDRYEKLVKNLIEKYELNP
jgi:hypothetical protein